MKNVDHSYEQALIMHDNLHIHVIMNIIVTPTQSSARSGRPASPPSQTPGPPPPPYLQLRHIHIYISSEELPEIFWSLCDLSMEL